MESNLKHVDYIDPDGRHKAVYLPIDAPESEAPNGIPIGPPNLEVLGLPLEVEVRLNNELFHRRIFTARDAVKRRADVVSALQSALKVDAGRVVDLYLGGSEDANGRWRIRREHPEIKPNPIVPDRGRGRPRKRA